MVVHGQWFCTGSLTDGIPPSLGQGRTAMGGRGREGERGTEGTHVHTQEYICKHVYLMLLCVACGMAEISPYIGMSFNYL